MELVINARVMCTNGESGHLHGIILNPINDEATHLIVNYQQTDYLVPINDVIRDTPEQINLDLSRKQLQNQTRFIETEYIRSPVERIEYAPLTAYYIPLVTMETITIKHEQIPEGELAIKRGMKIFAKTEQVGHVDELIVDPTDHHVTHIVLREGHLWGENDIVIGVSHIKEIDRDGIYLKTTKDQIAELPAVPVKRHLWS